MTFWENYYYLQNLQYPTNKQNLVCATIASYLKINIFIGD